MLKIPCSGEVCKFVRCKLKAIVVDHLIRYAIAGKVTLQLQNGGSGLGIWQPVHFAQIAVILYGDQVILAIKGKDVCGNLLPRTR